MTLFLMRPCCVPSLSRNDSAGCSPEVMRRVVRSRSRLHFVGEKSAAILRAGCVLGAGAYSSMEQVPPSCHHRRLAALFRHSSSRNPKFSLRSATLDQPSAVPKVTVVNEADQMVNLACIVSRSLRASSMRYFCISEDLLLNRPGLARLYY